MSKRVRGAIGTYMHWKYEADKNLAKRDAFKWTILRPGGLTNTPGTGKATIGRTHLGTTISVRFESISMYTNDAIVILFSEGRCCEDSRASC
jgi:hypothetical protein